MGGQKIVCRLSCGQKARSGIFRSRNSVIEWLKKKFIKNCSAFVVPGKSSLQYVMNYGVRKEQIFTPPNESTQNFLPGERRPSFRMRWRNARNCGCLPVFFCSWDGWSGKGCLICCRRMAN